MIIVIVINKMTNVYKRFGSEVADLLLICDSIKTIKENNGLLIELNIKNNYYKLCLTTDYPFRIPIHIQYNGIGWKYYLYQDHNPLVYIYLQLYYNRTCHQIIEHDDWVPAIKISRIIMYMDESIRIKREIVYRILCLKIKNKYRCYFVNFEKYLFVYSKSMYF